MFKSKVVMLRQSVGVAAVAMALAFAPVSAEDNAGGEQPTPEQMQAARAQMGPEISEEKYAAMLKLQTAIETCDQKMRNAVDDAAKAEIQKAKDQAYVDTGIDAATYAKMNQEITQIKAMLMAPGMSDNPQAAAGIEKALAMFPPVSVATVKAHMNAATPATPGATPGATPATTPATTPAATGAPAAESDLDPAKLSGTYVVDMDTTIEIMHPGMPANRKQMMIGMMQAHVSIHKITFGPGNKAASFTANPDGTETKSTGTFTYADKKLTIKHDDATQKDTVLDAAQRGDLLMFGKGMQKFAFKPSKE